jgi:hypothetical protein
MEQSLNIHHNEHLETPDKVQIQKMVLIHNALNDGWTIKKRKDTYVFVKKHKNNKKYLTESYLNTFITTNLG